MRKTRKMFLVFYNILQILSEIAEFRAKTAVWGPKKRDRKLRWSGGLL
jgi:hypothetical protein